jgi:hypothetical protein
MKKILIIIAILFSVNGKAQDTTYFSHHNQLYSEIRTRVRVTDSAIIKSHFHYVSPKRKRNDRIFCAVAGVIFGGITAWFWSK